MHDWRGPKPGQPLSTDEVVELALPSDSLPKGIKLDGMRGLIEDGNLQSIRMITMGEDYQDSLLSQLIEKYGQPTKQDTLPVQNSMGASFKSLNADWNASNLTVSFVGMAYRIDTGMIEVSTPAGVAGWQKLNAESKAQESKF